jgi:hypothetical protein
MAVNPKTELPTDLNSVRMSDTEQDTEHEQTTSKEVEGEYTYPEGGLRGWLVAMGAAMALFTTFGYANAFG